MKEDKRFLALEASAGSGKTSSLAVRFVALILDKQNERYPIISNILAITFTNKAANEMKEKIIKTFLSPQSYELSDISALLEISVDEVKNRLKERQKDFLSSELKIYTFDAFFAQILRQFSLNVGLLPDFSNGENLENLINQNLIKLLSKDEIKALASFILSANFKTAANFLEVAKQMSEYDIESSLVPAPSQSAVWQAYDELKKAALLVCEKKGVNAFNEVKNIKDFYKLLFDEKEAKIAKKAIDKCPFEKENLISALKAYYQGFCAHKISSFFEELKKYKKARKEAIKAKNAMDFSDVCAFVYELLRNDEKKFEPNELYFRLDGRIDDILIDEFQDTDARQFETLLPLIAEIFAGYGQNERLGSFFYVGDKKQSIYAFRGSHKEIFDYIKDSCFKQIKLEGLNINRRSTASIVDFVNETFSGKIDGYKAQLKDETNLGKVAGLVDISSFEYDKNEKNDESFFALLDSKVDFLLQKGIKPSQIHILCWQNEEITYIKEHLQSRGIKVASSAKELKASRQIQILLAYLRACLCPDESEYFCEFLARFGISAKPKKLAFNDPARTLKMLGKELGLNYQSKNCLKLYEIAASTNDIYEFFYKIQSDTTPASDTDEGGVNILTVHKSKGLSLEHCIVCDRFGKGKNDDSVFLSHYDLKSAKWQITLNERILEFLGDENYKNIKAKIEKINDDERLNKLYVAFTRAKYSLFIIARNGGDGNAPSYFKPYTSGGQLKEVLDLKDGVRGEFFAGENKQDESLFSEPCAAFESIPAQEVPIKEGSRAGAGLKNIYFGQALHYAFELSGEFDKKGIEQGLALAKNKFGYLLDEEAFSSIKAKITSFAELKKQKFADFKDYFKEQELIFKGKLLRLDALLLGENEAVILDFKSSVNAAKNSSEQMKLYKNAVEAIYKKPATAYFVTFRGDECYLKPLEF